MITAMTVLLTILIAAAMAVLVAYGVHTVVDTIKNDGYGRRSAQRTPRSHHPDPFDPLSRLA